VYIALGNDERERRFRYQSLFDQYIPECTLEEIRVATNKAWVLGDGKFKQQIEQQLGYALPPFPRGGDRKSNKYFAADKIWKIKVL
jgi:putative transposase